MLQKKFSILLVEDEENLHEALKLNLELEGYQVVSALDGMQAVKALQNQYFDLMILDIMLPDISGLEVLRYIQQKPDLAGIPVIVVSAKSLPADIKTGLGLYLCKKIVNDHNADISVTNNHPTGSIFAVHFHL